MRMKCLQLMLCSLCAVYVFGFTTLPVRRNEEEVINFYSKFGKLTVLSMDPLVLYLKGFIDADVCKAIIAKAESTGMVRSTVLNDQEESLIRTSSTCWLRDELDPDLLCPISEKVALMTEQPLSHQESLQVLRYEPGEEYQRHTDHIDSFNDYDCGGRLSTCIIFLNGAESFKGGETSFPLLKFYEVQPEEGSALFFINVHPYEDPLKMKVHDLTLHAGRPVISGVKYACNKWVHPLPYRTK